ncbi:MAG TPA: hypothetical protein VGI00_01535 [Streptosporangiaceae bacterium]|jgi:hypothetical protein
MTKRERSSRPDRPSLERSLDALLDRSLLDRDWRDSGWLDPGALDCASLDSAALDRVSLDRAALGRGATPDDDPARWRPVAQVLAALTSAPESSELTGEARALAEFRVFSEFRAFADVPARGADLPPPAPRRDPGRRTWLPGGRLAVAAATSAVLMGGLLALAYAGDLPMAAQRLAHDTINAPAARHDPEPAASSHPAESPTPAGSAGHQATHALVRPDRQVHSGSVSGHPHWPGSSSFPSGSPSGRLGSGWPGSGRQGQSGRSAEPWPTQAPWPSASISPPASATPSPSAAPSPSQSGPPSPQQSPTSPQSTPP